MTQADYNIEALEDCRSMLDGKAGPVGAIGDGFEGHQVDAGIFGELNAAQGLAGAIADLDSTAKKEFDAAEKLLRSASTSLDAIHTSVDEVDQDNAKAIQNA